MIERICPECATGNPVEAEQCAACGCSLDAPLVRRNSGPLSRLTPGLPVRWQQAGKAVALGAVALAVEAGAAWLQQRAVQKPAPLTRAARPRQAGFVAQQRVWETFEEGTLRRRVIEQTVWRFPEEP